MPVRSTEAEPVSLIQVAGEMFNGGSVMPNESEKSRHIGGKPDTRDEAQNRRALDKTSKDKDTGKSIEPKNADVGDVRHDR